MTAILELVHQREFSNLKGEMRERELLMATLDRAVLDYYGSENEVLGKEAGEWLFGVSDPQVAFSFEWICDFLFLEPAILRNRIRQLTIPREVSQAHRWLRGKARSERKLLSFVRRGVNY